MLFIETTDEQEFKRVLLANKKALDISFTKNFTQQEKTLEVFLLSVDHCTLNGFDEDRIIWNAGAFVNLISLDLKHIIRELLFTDNEWRRRIHARSAALLLYEGQKDLFTLLGRDFKFVIQKLSKYSDLEMRLKAVRKELNLLKEDSALLLGKIRNLVTAHRDENVKAQIDTIVAIDWLGIFGHAKKFDEILNQLGSILQEIINLSIKELDKNSFTPH